MIRGLAGMLFFLTGCVALQLDSNLAKAQREIELRARVDLGPCAQREYELLERRKQYPVRIAAIGCGAMGIYEKQLRGVVTHKHSGSWTLVSKALAQTEALRDYR